MVQELHSHAWRFFKKNFFRKPNKMYIPRLLFFFLISSQIIFAQNEFFDDFNYTDPNDTIIEHFGWIVLDGPNYPGQNGPVPYIKDNVEFIENTAVPNDRILTLSTQTTNQLADRSFSRVEYSEYIFLEGTYAARVHFDNASAASSDGNVQTFYTIFNAPSGDTTHAECDFEYLAYNIWGGGNFTNTLYATTWESYILSPWLPTNASTGSLEDYSDDWKILIFTVMDGTVTYYVDGVLFATHTVADQDGTTSVYPDSDMQISLANWIWSNNALPLGPSPNLRTSTMEVDWVYHLKEGVLNQEEVLTKVNNFRAENILRKNSMNEVVSTIEPSNDNLFLVYPNPGQGNNLSLKSKSKKSVQAKIEIMNTQGILVFQKEIRTSNTNEVLINLAHLPKGLYLIAISTEDKRQVVKWMLQ